MDLEIDSVSDSLASSPPYSPPSTDSPYSSNDYNPRPSSHSRRYVMDSDDDDEVMEVPDEYAPVLEAGENYVVTPTSVISDGIRFPHPVVALPRLSLTLRGLEIVNLTVRIPQEPSLPSPGPSSPPGCAAAVDDEDDVIFLYEFSPSSPPPVEPSEVITLD